MLRVVKKSSVKEFIIGTEEGLINRLRREFSDKMFYSIKKPRLCNGMKNITLHDLYDSLQHNRFIVELPMDIIDKAKKSLDRMLLYV